MGSEVAYVTVHVQIKHNVQKHPKKCFCSVLVHMAVIEGCRSTFAVLDLAEEVWETFPACYAAQKNEFILPLWRFHQKLGAKRLLNSL